MFTKVESKTETVGTSWPHGVHGEGEQVYQVEANLESSGSRGLLVPVSLSMQGSFFSNYRREYHS
jgi:hypothetical protein